MDDIAKQYNELTSPIGILTTSIAEPTYLFRILGKDNQEIIRLENNGEIFVHEKLIENDKQVVDGFREFLRGQGLY